MECLIIFSTLISVIVVVVVGECVVSMWHSFWRRANCIYAHLCIEMDLERWFHTWSRCHLNPIKDAGSRKLLVIIITYTYTTTHRYIQAHRRSATRSNIWKWNGSKVDCYWHCSKWHGIVYHWAYCGRTVEHLPNLSGHYLPDETECGIVWRLSHLIFFIICVWQFVTSVNVCTRHYDNVLFDAATAAAIYHARLFHHFTVAKTQQQPEQIL